MELVYLYAGNLGKCIDDKWINFSKDFEATYDRENSKLTIKKLENSCEKYPYRDDKNDRQKIDINVLVGKNGVGKSTIMRLLGLPERDLLSYFGLYEKINYDKNVFENIRTWFAVYHLKKDEFFIEGYWSKILKGNLEDTGVELSPPYAIRFRYDFSNNRFMQVEPSPVLDDLFYIYFSNNTELSWFKDYKLFKYNVLNEHVNRLIRLAADRSSYESIYKYLKQAHSKKADVKNDGYTVKMGTKPGTVCKISLEKNEYLEDFDIDEPLSMENEVKRKAFCKKAAQYIYHNEDIVPAWNYNPLFSNKNLVFSKKEHFILAYLEALITNDIYPTDHMPSEEKKGYYGQIGMLKTQDAYDYDARKNYLLHYVECGRKQGLVLDNGYKADWIKIFETIPEKYFSGYYQIEVPMNEAKKSGIEELITVYDRDNRKYYGRYHRDNINLSFHGMSSGEAHFIDLYAAIHGAMTVWEEKYNFVDKKAYRETCILLLDEPDMSFHPEWSRTFIKNLVDFLKEEYKKYDFQVIITTHSPLMLSDVPRNSIHCLERDSEGNLKITKPEYGLLSGINDILIDGFFTNSLFGAFAEQYANEIIKGLDELELEFTVEKYDELSAKIELLGEGLIKDSFKKRLSLAKRWFDMRDDDDQD